MHTLREVLSRKPIGVFAALLLLTLLAVAVGGTEGTVPIGWYVLLGFVSPWTVQLAVFWAGALLLLAATLSSTARWEHRCASAGALCLVPAWTLYLVHSTSPAWTLLTSAPFLMLVVLTVLFELGDVHERFAGRGRGWLAR